MKKKIIFWVVMVFVLSSFASVPVEAKPKPKLSAKSKTMYVGKTAAVKLKSAGKVKWKTSKKSVVSISKKKKNKVWIKAKKAGKATITATYKKRTYKCRITVKKKKEKQAEADKTVMNASDITLYYVSEDDKPYLTLDPSHIYQYQFQVTGTKQEGLVWLSAIIILDNKGNMGEWARNFRQHENIGSLDRNVVAHMVERVFVYSAERIEVVFNFRDEFESAMQYIHEDKGDMGKNHAVGRKEAV